MTIHITAIHAAFALAFCGGFFVSMAVMHERVRKLVTAKYRTYYRDQYNYQMSEALTRYNQQRVAMIYQYENLKAECERELEWLKAGCDPDRTKKVHVTSNWDAMGAETEKLG